MFLNVSSFFGKVIDVIFLFSFVVSERCYKGCGLVFNCLIYLALSCFAMPWCVVEVLYELWKFCWLESI